MKRILPLLLIVLLAAAGSVVPLASAQDYRQIGCTEMGDKIAAAIA